MFHILVVDDEKNYGRVLGQLLRDAGYRVSAAENGFAALDVLSREKVSLVLSDLKMPRMSGIELFTTVRRDYGDIPFVIMTAFATVETALEAIKGGVYDYLLKPFNNDEMILTIEKALEYQRIKRENQSLHLQVEASFGKDIIGESPAIKKLLAEIDQVAQAPTPVLISGESGVGKELVARIIHRSRGRTKGPWVALNCSAFTETLFESEIFGHERGAFTGATERKKGLVEMADGGTLFLDEISELPLTLQPKLLRLLQEKCYRRVGGTVEIRSDVRVLAATNRNLAASVEAGSFRKDLFFRLNVIELIVPPLRERVADIPLLAHHFLGKLSVDLSRIVTDIAPQAMERLQDYSWPGNVRELRNVIERGILFSPSEVLPAGALPDQVGRPEKSAGNPLRPKDWEDELEGSLPDCLERIEERLIRRALVQSGGVQAQAAARLGISRSNLQHKLKKYGID